MVEHAASWKTEQCRHRHNARRYCKEKLEESACQAWFKAAHRYEICQWEIGAGQVVLYLAGGFRGFKTI